MSFLSVFFINFFDRLLGGIVKKAKRAIFILYLMVAINLVVSIVTLVIVLKN